MRRAATVVVVAAALAVAGALTLGCGGVKAGAGSRPAAAAELEVRGMTCSGCEAAIEARVGKLPGVAEVKADHEAGEAEVAYDPEAVSLAEIERAIESLGYEVVGAHPRQGGAEGEAAGGAS